MFDSEGLKAELSNHFPYVSVRVYHAVIDTVFIRLALQPKDQWPNGYFENSKYGIFVIQNGKIELSDLSPVCYIRPGLLMFI
jgi:hypothetical protein